MSSPLLSSGTQALTIPCRFRYRARKKCERRTVVGRYCDTHQTVYISKSPHSRPVLTLIHASPKRKIEAKWFSSSRRLSAIAAFFSLFDSLFAFNDDGRRILDNNFPLPPMADGISREWNSISAGWLEKRRRHDYHYRPFLTGFEKLFNGYSGARVFTISLRRWVGKKIFWSLQMAKKVTSESCF